MATLMLGEITNALQDYLNGNRMSEEEIDVRRKICNGCEFKAKFLLSFCTKCHCKLEGELGALSAPRKECPVGLWKSKAKNE